MSSSSPSLRELIDLEELQSIQDSFARAVGISSVILSPEGEPLTRFTNPTGFCSLIQSTEKGTERCFRSFMEMGKIALGSEEPEIFYCFADGGHFVAPIIIDGEHKGTMFAGQFIHEKFSSKQLHDLEEIAHEIDLDPGLLVKEAEKMRVVGEDVIRNYSNLLFKIVETIARRGAQAAELSRANVALEKAHKALELRFRDVAGTMSDWVWEVDTDARYTYCSEKVKDVLGYSAEEMIGKTPFDLVLPDGAESVGAEFAELVRERRPLKNVENWLRTRDGRPVCMLVSGVPVLNDAGELLGYRGVDSDITERKKAKEVLRATEERFRMMFESMSNAVAVYDAVDRGKNFIFKDFNKAAEKLEGVKKEDLIGKRVPDVFPGVADFGLCDVFRRVWQTGEPENFPISFYKDDKIAGWRENYVYKLPSGEIVAIYEDVTEQKKAEDALKDRVCFEKIVTAISTSFINLAPDEVDSGIEDALRCIGEFSGVDRSYIFQFTDDKATMDNTHEWCAEGIVPQIENLKGLQTADFPWMMKRLYRFDTVHIPSVADLPPEAGATKEIMQSQDILSAILVPTVYGGTLLGYLGFDSVRHEKSWSEDNIALLRIVGEIFVNTLERRHVLDALRSSEAKFRVIIEKNPLGAIIVDKERKIRDTNDAAVALIGRPIEEIIGRVCHEFVCPRAQNDCPIYDHGQTMDHEETILLSKDRGEVPIEKTVTQIEMDGEPMLIEMFYDITRRKAAEEAIRESEEKIRMITASANDSVIMMDHEGNISYWNKAAERMFDYTEEEATGKNLHALLMPERFHAAFSKGFEGFKETGKGAAIGKTLELAAFGKDGKEFLVELSLSAVKLKDRWNAIGFIRDITKRKAAEEEIKKKADELEKFNRLAVGRELKMIELKKEINALLEESGKEPGYEIVGES